MAKHGLGRGLSALFSLYDDPKLANSEVEKKKLADITKNAEEQKLELKKQAEKERLANTKVEEKPEIKTEIKTAQIEEKPSKTPDFSTQDDILARAKSLLGEKSEPKPETKPEIKVVETVEEKIKTPEPLVLRTDVETDNEEYLRGKKILEQKLERVEKEITSRQHISANSTLSKPINQQASAPVDNMPTNGDVRQLPINMLEVNLEQPRKSFDKEKLHELADSIKQHGIIQPIIVVERDGKYMIVAGERRYRASKMAGVKVVPVIIKNYTNRQIKEIALIENLQREDLNPVETAYALKQLIDEYNFTQEELAARIGKSRPMVTNTLRILKLEPEVLAMVEKGKLSLAHAKSIVSIQDRDEQIKLAKKATDNKIPVKELETMVQEILNPETVKKKKQTISMELKDLIARMQQAFNTKVGLVGSDARGRIYLDYYNRDDLDRISSLLNKLGF